MNIMSKPWRAVLALLGAGAVIVGAYGGAALAEGGVDDAEGGVDNHVTHDQYPQPANPKYPSNSTGLTYGSVAEANVPEEEPDLILVVTDDGERQGYVYADDLNPPNFESPEEAVAWTKERYSKDVVLDVFESDGTTKIGTFTIAASSE